MAAPRPAPRPSVSISKSGCPRRTRCARWPDLGRDITPRELALELEPRINARWRNWGATMPGSTSAIATIASASTRPGRPDRRVRRGDPPPDAPAQGARVRLAIETHADLTVAELLGVLERLDPDVAGVNLDTGNLLMRLDDPIEAVEKLAPFVLATHIKDAVLAFTRRGLCWQARPIGSGILPLPDMLTTILRGNPSIALSIKLRPPSTTYRSTIGDGWASSPTCGPIRWPPSSAWRRSASGVTRMVHSPDPSRSRPARGLAGISTGWPARWAISVPSSRR